jgi:hypothetical protein
MVISFKGAHFPPEIILMGVRWYVAYPLSYRHVEDPPGLNSRGGTGLIPPNAEVSEQVWRTSGARWPSTRPTSFYCLRLAGPTPAKVRKSIIWNSPVT